jgi:hypothetical protein
MTRSISSPTAPHRRGPALGLVAFVLASGVTGCYRAAGVPKNTPIAYEIPADGGDRVAGNKATSGPGDYYLGNDFVQMAIDGAGYGDRSAQFGAASGGSILDVGTIGLDNSFHRVSMPSDNVEQLMPVINQDPELPLVFDTFRPSTNSDGSSLEMRGGLMDPNNKLGLPRDANGRVTGIEVIHTVSLPARAHSFDLSTTLINHTGAPIPVYSIGDFLRQRGGGLRVLAPGQETSGFNAAGVWSTPAPVNTWGAQIPGSTFDTTTGGVQDAAKRFNPLATAVKAHGVGFQGAEPSAETFDFHQSLGLASLDEGFVLVSSDAQDALNEIHPRFPSRVVVGKITPSNPQPLASGASLTYNRRLYLVGGVSTQLAVAGSTVYPVLPMQATEAFNYMALDRNLRFSEPIGSLNFSTFGTAVRGGAFPTEVRLERFDPTSSAWKLEYVDMWDAGEIHGINLSRAMTVFSPDSVSDAQKANPTNPYRVILTNKQGSNTWTQLTNVNTNHISSFATPIVPLPDAGFTVGEPLAPESSVSGIVDAAGNVVGSIYTNHLVVTREISSDNTVFQPARVRIEALDTNGNLTPANDPSLQRSRIYEGYFSPITKDKVRSGFDPGNYSFRAGNEIFASTFNYGGTFQPLPLFPGKYRITAGRGPLGELISQDFSAVASDSNGVHTLQMVNGGTPSAWISFDLPGPTQATTGGMVPAEMLTSALAENVQVVARTEEDRLVSAWALYNSFRADFSDAIIAPSQRAVVGQDPLVVGARSSTLWNPTAPTPVQDGHVTALFTPEPNANRLGGARVNRTWNLADFMANAEGGFTVVHRPRDPGSSDPSVPKGLFAAHNFNPTVALGTGVNLWWNQTGPLSDGRKMGDFDAIELLRAEYSDTTGPLDLRVGANATAWFNEYKAVRADWFAILKQQTPTAFTKALGLSGAKYSVDTPVGLARTYLQLGAVIDQATLTPVLDSLRAGRAVASTGPFLDVQVGGQGPGGFLTGTNATAPLSVVVYAPSWVPVDEVRVVVNGSTVYTIPFNATNFTQDLADARKWVLTNAAFTTLTFTPGKDAYVVVEAGVSNSTSGAYAAGTQWARMMKGIYPIAITNPIFVDVNGGGYVAPGLP